MTEPQATVARDPDGVDRDAASSVSDPALYTFPFSFRATHAPDPDPAEEADDGLD